MTPGFFVTTFLLGSAIGACVELLRKHQHNNHEDRSRQSLFHVTATPETRAHMALWRQDIAKSAPDDLQILTKLERWIENPPPHGRMKWTNTVLVDFKNSMPEFRINEAGRKVPNKYPPFEYNGYRIHGLWAKSVVPLYGNVWECSIDYFEKLKHE
jgi:hypothetical protein